jgi:hypothetical protein
VGLTQSAYLRNDVTEVLARFDQFQVAYLLAADKYFRLLLIRLDSGTQPVSLTQNGFSKPRPCLLACI